MWPPLAGRKRPRGPAGSLKRHDPRGPQGHDGGALHGARFRSSVWRGPMARDTALPHMAKS
eukprot:scaffold6203_cov147-Isochrysis_galbana.AAC.1